MRNPRVTAAAAFVLGGIMTGALIAGAQQAGRPMPPPPEAGRPGPGPEGGPDGGHWWGPPGWRMGGPGGGPMHPDREAWRPMLGTFALVHRAEDRKLTPPDVKKIAEAFLLWNGNRTWQVTNVAPDGGAIAFDFATPDGSTIARFVMDPKTGRLTRRG